VLIRGLLEPATTLLSFFRGFVAYGGSDGGATFKIVAQWHQYHGVLRAVERAVDALVHKKDGKGGVIWFTQGSGKSCWPCSTSWRSATGRSSRTQPSCW
jgi:type I restriction enzyme R subunit